jgi:hypothetical protein
MIYHKDFNANLIETQTTVDSIEEGQNIKFKNKMT